MAQPIFKIGTHDYTKYILELKPSRNDIDADGAGRNLLDGQMYRTKIASKLKWTVTFSRLTSAMMTQLCSDMNAEFVSITMLDPTTGTQSAKSYYTSTITGGAQRYIGGDTVYDGVTFNITER